MSDYHIRETSADLKTVSVVFHIPIPSTNNAVDISWSDALVLSLGGADEITSVMSDIGIGDEAEMKAGSIYEKVQTVRFSSLDLTNAQRLEEVEAAYIVAKEDILADKQITLNFYGKSGDVV